MNWKDVVDDYVNGFSYIISKENFCPEIDGKFYKQYKYTPERHFKHHFKLIFVGKDGIDRMVLQLGYSLDDIDEFYYKVFLEFINVLTNKDKIFNAEIYETNRDTKIPD
jgi:hypothetical protein